MGGGSPRPDPALERKAVFPVCLGECFRTVSALLPDAALSGPFMKETILLVDDEEGIRNVLGIVLRDAGYNVLTAAGVSEAYACFLEHRPAIIVTDIKMPGQSGIDLLRRVKERDAEVEVIMLTGHGDLELAIQSLQLDATDFLTKPVNNDVLEFSLRRARERIRMREQIRGYAANLEAMVREKSAKLVEAERQLAALQVVDGIASGFRSLVGALARESGIGPDTEPPEIDGLFNELPWFVAVHNRALEVVAINKLYRERLGDLVGRPSWQAYAPGLSANPQGCPVGRVLSLGVGQRSNEVLTDKTGLRLPVIIHAVPIYDNEGEVELILELAVDTSEVRRLREDLRLTRERYRRLFDESPSYVAVVDRNMRVLDANRRFRDDFGDILDRRCHELSMHKDSVCLDCPAVSTFADGLVHQFETVVTATDGRRVNVLVATAPLRDADGHITQVMELSTDITELRRLQDHLAQLGLLLGSTAHGIKGILTAIDGSVYRMGSGLAHSDPVRVEDGFRDIRLLVGRLRKMVLDILYYSKDREFSREKISLSVFAGEIASLVESKAEELGVRLCLDFPARDAYAAGGETFEADAEAVTSALVNILDNALDACAANPKPPEGGSRIVFATRSLPEAVHFTVEDNGPGMDEDTCEKLFNLFYSTKGSAGTGIGLYVASQVAARHGGSLTVTSAPGRGAVFTMVLPRKPPENAQDNGGRGKEAGGSPF